MKPYIKFLGALALGASMAACNDDFETPPMIVPEATIKANTDIAAFKAEYWQSDRNYCSEVAAKAGGEDVIISGTVISSDSTGNVFKSIVIYDGSAALAIGINAYDLYQSYQYGQQVVVNCTGLKVGGYNGLMQLGAESSYNGSPSMTFMDKDLFAEHAQINGLARPQSVVPILRTIEQINSYAKNQDSLRLYQSMLVKIDSVSFVDAGQQFAPNGNANRYVTDAAGNRINVRCSGYADFKNDIIPSGRGCVTAILSYYGSDWQLLLNNLGGLQHFSGAPVKPDTPDTPDTPTGVVTFKKAASVEAGKQYIMLADKYIAKPLDRNYGYLNIDSVSVAADGSFQADAKHAFTFEATTGGFAIKGADKYYYMTGSYNSFNVDASMPAEGGVWSATANADGSFTITNAAVSKSIQYDPQFKSFGAYADHRGTYPSLYEIVK